MTEKSVLVHTSLNTLCCSGLRQGNMTNSRRDCPKRCREWTRCDRLIDLVEIIVGWWRVAGWVLKWRSLQVRKRRISKTDGPRAPALFNDLPVKQHAGFRSKRSGHRPSLCPERLHRSLRQCYWIEASNDRRYRKALAHRRWVHFLWFLQYDTFPVLVHPIVWRVQVWRHCFSSRWEESVDRNSLHHHRPYFLPSASRWSTSLLYHEWKERNYFSSVECRSLAERLCTAVHRSSVDGCFSVRHLRTVCF